jgi:hypothetical protein
MGVVIEIFVKHPGGPTRIKATDIHTWHHANHAQVFINILLCAIRHTRIVPRVY